MKKFSQNFKKTLKGRGFSPHLFSEMQNNESWDSIIGSFNHNSIYYRSNTIELEFEYHLNSKGENLSFVNKGKDSFIFKCFGNEKKIIVYDILFESKFSNSKAKKISKILCGILLEIDSKIIYNSILFSKTNSNYLKYYLLNKMSKKTLIELAIDLEEDLENIWSSLRKSYKPLINKNSKIYSVSKDCTSEIWDLCKELHIACSGKQTRSDKTWQTQWEAIKSRQAIVYFIELNNKIIGFAYFIYDKVVASYFSAAYQRSNQSDQSLGHLILWEAISDLKKRGIKNLYLGSYTIDLIDGNTKISNIISFKTGFSNLMNISFE